MAPAKPIAATEAPAIVAAGVAYACTLWATQLVVAPALRLTTGSRTLGMRLAPNALGVAAVAVGSCAALAAADAARDSAREGRRRLPASTALAGTACFVLLGGRFWALSPSSFTTLGTFANTARGSLPATLSYATSEQRARIQELGRRFGCHTCGRRWRTRFNADHMPPLAEVKRANAALWRRALGRTVSQRFHPQCTACTLIAS